MGGWTASDFEDKKKKPISNTWTADDFIPKPIAKFELPQYKPVAVRPSFNESDIFEDAPNSVSFFPPKVKDTGFWENVRNLNLEETAPFKAIKAIGDIPYKIPLTQRFFTTLGNTIGGEGTVKADDGSAMQKMDAGKISNTIADIAGTGVAYGMKLPGMSNSIQGSINRVLNPLETKVLGNLPNMPKVGFKAAEYGTNAIKNGLDMSVGNVIQGVAQGQNLDDIKTNGINGLWQGAAFGTALKGIGDIKGNINPKWETTFESKVQPKSARNMTFKNNGDLVPQEGLLQLPSPRGIEAPLNMLPKGETPIEIGGYKDNIIPKVTIKKQKNDFIPMQARDFDNIGNKTIKAYQQENPSVKPFIQQEAEIIKGELERTIKPSKGANYVNGEYIGYGNGRITSDTVAQIRDITGKSYEDINKAVEDIIADHGRENNALAKKVELIIDDRLTNGYYDDISGIEIPPSAEYIVNKANFDELTPKVQNTKEFSGYVNNKIPVQQRPLNQLNNISAKNLSNITPISDNTKVLPQYAREDIRKPVNTLTSQNKPLEAQTIAKEEAAFTQKPSLGATDRVHSMTQIVSSDEAKVKPNIKDRWNKLYTRFVDSVSPIKKVGEDAYIKATNSKNAGGIVDNILTENLVNRQGKKIGESFKNIVKDIPEDKQDDFMNYVLQKHNIDRAREGKHVYTDFTPEQSTKATQLIEQLHPEYKALNDRLVKFVRDFESEWGNKSGLISDELWQNLQDTYKNYVPTQRSFDELEQGFSAANGRGFVDQGNTLKKATGSERDIINPLENIMKLVNKTVRTAKYNEVGQSMLSEIRRDPATLKHLAEIIPEGEAINPNVKNVVSVLENGKPVNVKVNNKQLLEALQGINKANVGDIEAAVKKGTNIFKSLITTKNPVFAVRNIARDIPTAYVNGSEANPVKFIRDLGKAGKDIVTNSERFQQYKGVGGGGSNFFKSDNTAKNVKELTKTNLLKKVGNGIEHINNIIESAPRLAEFNRILDKTGDVNKALFAASDVTTNFSRGGDITKHIDSFVPYLNAGVQGLDKLARQFVDKPIPTAAKGLVGITSATLILDHMNKDNPEYQKLDNRTKDNYFILPDANKDGKFIKIPKSRELGVLFGSLFERSLRASRGEDEAFKGYGNTVATSFSPANPLESNIFSPALGLKANKDFANRDIVPRAMLEDNRSKYLQYDEKTSEITKKIAEETHKLGIDLSPKQMDYLIRSYTGVIGQLGLPATTKATMTGTTTEKLLKPITTQFIADPLYNNQNIGDFYDNYDNIKNKAADKNITEQIPSKVLTPEEKVKSTFTKTSSTISDLNKKIKEAEAKNDLEEIKRLRAKIIEAALKANNTYNEFKR